MIDVVDLLSVQLGLIDSGVGGSLDNSEDHSLVLGGRQLPLREHVERNNQQDHNRP